MLVDKLTRIYAYAQAHLAPVIPPFVGGAIIASAVIYTITHSCRFEEVC
jgi:hypothetical protein